MKAVLLSGLYLLGGCAAVWAQPLSVYSDLAQIDGLAKVTAPETPREILSPALVRNGFNSFQVVVEAPAEAKWWLFVGQNPENAVKVTLYRELAGSLEPVDLPYQSSGTQVLWMDLWVEGERPIQRIKVEPELYLNDDWVTYPIEGRVMEARVPLGPPLSAQSPRQNPWALMRGDVCHVPGDFSSGPGPSLEGLRFRNVQQDLRLMDAHEAAKEDVRKLLGGCDAEIPSDPESYLRIRDYLFRLR
ncbi:MAG TPA: hypothetical protein VGG72_09780 [Bryobacteraceae bacterium]|jgi:hypothetical protein